MVFAISRFTRDELVDTVGLDSGRIFLCPLGVDPRFTEIPRRPPGDVSRLIFFGRLTREG